MITLSHGEHLEDLHPFCFSLRVALTNNSLEWVQDFGNKGLKQVCLKLEFTKADALKLRFAGAVGAQRMLQKRFQMGQSAARVRNQNKNCEDTTPIDHFNQVYQMLEGHHEQQGGLEEFVRTQGGAHTSGSVCPYCLAPPDLYFHCRSITPTLPLVMLEAVKLMAAVCLVNIFEP